MIPRFPKKPASPSGPPAAQSTNVASFHYDPEQKSLNVAFHGGRSYRYDNVSAETAAGLHKAKSKGGFLNEHVIPHHTFTRMDRAGDGRKLGG